MDKYVVLEVGKSAYTEFLMKNGEYMLTEDAIVVAIVSASSEEEAMKKAISIDYCEERQFSQLVAHKLA